METLEQFFKIRMQLESIKTEPLDITDGAGIAMLTAEAHVLDLDMEALYAIKPENALSGGDSFFGSIINKITKSVSTSITNYTSKLDSYISRQTDKAFLVKELDKAELIKAKAKLNGKVNLKEANSKVLLAMMTFHKQMGTAIRSNNFEYIKQENIENESIQLSYLGRSKVFMGRVKGTFTPITGLVKVKVFPVTKLRILTNATTLSGANVDVKTLTKFLSKSYVEKTIEQIEDREISRAKDIMKLLDHTENEDNRNYLSSMHSYIYERMASKVTYLTNAYTDANTIVKYLKD